MTLSSRTSIHFASLHFSTIRPERIKIFDTFLIIHEEALAIEKVFT